MAEGPNLVINGDFPTNVASWEITVTGSGGEGSFTWTSSGNGRSLLYAFAPEFGAVVVTVWQSIAVAAFTDYKAVFDIQSVANIGSLGLVGVGTTNAGYEHGSTTVGVAGGMKTFFFTTGAETTAFMTMTLTHGGAPVPRAGSYEIDDITLRLQFDPLFLPIINIIES